MQEVKMVNPFTGEISVKATNSAEVVHGVDSFGNYIGLVPKEEAYVQVLSPPAGNNFKWSSDSASWEYTETLDEIRSATLSEIDAQAGVTRLKYITEVPGQQATYIVKLKEAEEYIQDASIVGAYLRTESEILQTSLLTTAQGIITTANTWNNILGPQIEGIRLKNKLAVSAAATIDEIYSIKALNIAELSVI